MGICNPASFYAEARYQGVCAACEKPGAFHAHHVVDRGWLKARGLEENDPRNALRLCIRCHTQHEYAGPGKVEIALRQLTTQSIAYAFEVMGIAASVWLRRHYTGEDPRVTAYEEIAA